MLEIGQLVDMSEGLQRLAERFRDAAVAETDEDLGRQGLALAMQLQLSALVAGELAVHLGKNGHDEALALAKTIRGEMELPAEKATALNLLRTIAYNPKLQDGAGE